MTKVIFAAILVAGPLLGFYMIFSQGMSGAILGGKIIETLGKVNLQKSITSKKSLNFLKMKKKNCTYYVIEIYQKSNWVINWFSSHSPIQLTEHEFVKFIDLIRNKSKESRNAKIGIESDKRYREINVRNVENSSDLELNFIHHRNKSPDSLISLIINEEALAETSRILEKINITN